LISLEIEFGSGDPKSPPSEDMMLIACVKNEHLLGSGSPTAGNFGKTRASASGMGKKMPPGPGEIDGSLRSVRFRGQGKRHDG